MLSKIEGSFWNELSKTQKIAILAAGGLVLLVTSGGTDNEENWVTTSMKNNSIKSNYAIEEIHWKLYPKGNISEWDGLTKVFLEIVDNDMELLEDNYIKSWYKVLKMFG